MSFSFFLMGFLFLPDLLWWWWADRRVRGRPVARALVALFAVAMAGYVLWMLLLPADARRSHRWMPVGGIAAIYLWHLLALPLTLILAGISGGVGLVRRRPPPTDPSRRSFLAAAAALLPPLLTGATAAYALPRRGELRVRAFDVRVPSLPPALDGLSIAHVSDLHYGKFTTPGSIERLVATVNGLRADLVLFTGDLVDLSLDDLPPAIATLRRLDPGRGLFLCEGNHDLIDDGAEFRRGVREAGLALLGEEAASVEVRGARVQILGSRWGRGDAERGASIARTLHARDPDAFPILLAHHPHAFDDAAGVPLTLSGHTHGGLLMLNERLGAGPALYRYWSGLYRRGDRALVVSNGVGNWFPLRTHAPAEVVRLVLRT